MRAILTPYPHLSSLALLEVFSVTLLAVIWTVYERTGRSDRIAGTAAAGAVLLISMALLATSSYVVAVISPFPLFDHGLAAADRVLGFDWNAWTAALEQHPSARRVLDASYNAMVPELVGAVLYLGFCREARSLLTSLIVAGLITVCVSWLVPAIGHLPNAPHVPTLLALRAGKLLDGFPQGLVSFPSYHAAVAILLTIAFRRHVWLFPAACVLNGLMVASTLSTGGHYLVDVLAGGGVAWISHLIAQRDLRSRMGRVGRESESQPLNDLLAL
jgi:membrane-associated phospholipid phosphatase